jgi:DNA-binding SARP family transcriptional activator/pimeloyl-ACP methyl ester carboxylesterase
MQSTEDAVRVRLFGPLELDVAGTPLGPRDLGGVKPKQLLEILLLERDHAVPKDRLADRLWGERLPERVAATIETYVSVVRRRLDRGAAGLGRRLIVTEPGGYRLPTTKAIVDADRFDALIRRAAASEDPERRAALETATAMSEHELLADEPYAEWVLAPREHVRARRVQALSDLGECCLRLGDPRAALAAADELLTLEPAHERAYRLAMTAHSALGDRGAALRAYRACHAALAGELGVAPTKETADLHAALLRGEDPAGHAEGREPAAPAPRGAATRGLPIRYATSDGARIAYQVVGDGPVDLVFVPSFVTNLGATWDDPTYAAFLRRLATPARLILFDKRGTGLSDPALDFPSTSRRSDDLLSVLDAAGSRRAVLFGVCGGGALCAHFAASHPDRTEALILHNSFARLLRTDDYPWGWPAADYERFLAAFEEAWLSGTGIERRNPGLADNPRYREWFARYVRLAASPWMSRRLAELNAEIDVRPLLAGIRAPTLVICRTEDAWLSPENSRYLAAHIPGARLLELPGVDHDPWVGDTEPVLEAIESFAGVPAA